MALNFGISLFFSKSKLEKSIKDAERSCNPFTRSMAYARDRIKETKVW